VRLPLGRAGVTVVSLTAAVLLVAALPAGAVASVSAPSPQARAAALGQQVRALEVRAEVATQAYDAIEAKLGQLTTAHLLEQQRLAADRQARSATVGEEDTGLSALYESGGPIALYSTLFSPGGLSNYADQLETVGRLVSAQEAVSARQQHADGRIASLTSRLGALAARQTTLQEKVAATAKSIGADLVTQQHLLAVADAQVRALERADQTSTDSADAAAFAAALATAGGGGNPTPPTPWAAKAIAAIKTRLGTPYLWGGTGPEAFDCSGLTGYSYETAGVSMPRTAAQQYFAGTHPGLADLRPGDLLFWATNPADPETIYHVAMYAGGDLMWSDDQTGDTARLQPIWFSGFAGATQVVPSMAAEVPGPRW
jgi:cell wall-associated NlpC family hydrolase